MEVCCLVPQSGEGWTLAGFLRNALRLSTTQIRRLKAADALLVNGTPVFSNYRLRAGDMVFLSMTEPAPVYPAETGLLCVLYEDDQLLAVSKPQGMLVHPTHSRFTGTLANRAWRHIRDAGGDGCHAVNRLDRDTGGVVLFAKNAWACSRMADGVTEKVYLAVACGEPAGESGRIELPIKRERPEDMRRVCAPDGAPAVTEYTVLERRAGLSLLRLRLLTGRTHQIRVHLAALGCPVLGDRLYGTAASMLRAAELDQTVQALWCVRMAFRQPLTGEGLVAEACPNAKIFEFFGFRY